MEKHERTNKRESGVIVGSRSEQSRVGQGIVFRGSRALWIFSKIPRVTTSRRSLIPPDGKEVATVNTVVYRSSLSIRSLFFSFHPVQIERKNLSKNPTSFAYIYSPRGESIFFLFSFWGNRFNNFVPSFDTRRIVWNWTGFLFETKSCTGKFLHIQKCAFISSQIEYSWQLLSASWILGKFAGTFGNSLCRATGTRV